MKSLHIVLLLILLIIITTLALRYVSVGDNGDIEHFGTDMYSTVERISTMPKYVVSFDKLDNSLNNFFLYFVIDEGV
jgi:hypothetical protein